MDTSKINQSIIVVPSFQLRHPAWQLAAGWTGNDLSTGRLARSTAEA